MCIYSSNGFRKELQLYEAIGKTRGIICRTIFELIVICSTSANFDQTVKTFSPAIQKSKLIAVKDTELLDWLNKYMKRILKYNAINEYVNSDCKVINDELRRLINKKRLDQGKIQDLKS